MGRISSTLGQRFAKDPHALRLMRAEVRKLEAREFVNEDPLHASYARAQHLVSVFAEAVSPLPEFEMYYGIVAKAEDEYVPGGPPISPLSGSFFTTWAFFDVRFGPDAETMGTVLLDMADRLGVSSPTCLAVRQFQQTRMGIYEHTGANGMRQTLRELLTGEKYSCIVPAGHVGRKGELWYARICPPLPGRDYHVVITTPYVLTSPSKADWVAYLERTLDGIPGNDLPSRLQHLLKFGRHPHGWSEFVFEAYCGHTREAIFLEGIPDRPATLPQADATERRPCGGGARPS